MAGPFATGAVGAGTGATVAKWRGPGESRPGGLGSATRTGPDGVVVAALIACNAWGEPRGADQAAVPSPGAPGPWDERADPFANTTIGVIATNARLDKAACLLVAQSGHDGLARALEPVHAAVDGDALVAVATCDVELPAPGGPVAVEVVRALAAAAVEDATLGAVPGKTERADR